MATNFPASLDDSTTLPNPSGTTPTNAGTVTHAVLHDNVNGAIMALEAKVGNGASTPNGGALLISETSGGSIWDNLRGDVTSNGASTTLANTGVVSGTYTNANITVDSKGRITAAASGASGGGGGGGTVSPLTTKGDLYTYSTLNDRLPVGTDGQILTADSTKATGLKWAAAPATGVTSVSVVSANGLAGSVATPGTTPAITLSTTVTGILKGNGTGISAAVASDFPTLNQNTTGNAATATTATNLSGNITEGQVTNLSTDLAAKAPLASPALTGTPTAPTAATTDSSTKIATTAFVKTAAGAQSVVANEVPGGTIDGTNKVFTLASTPASSSLNLYKNGIRLKAGGADYTLSGNTITFVTAPPLNAVLLADYNVSNTTYSVGTNSIITDEVPTGAVSGANTAFSALRAYIAGSLEVFVNGIKQARGTHFTETTPSSGAFTMSDAPLTGDNIIINYQYNLNPSSNADTVDGIHANSTPTANQLMPLDSNAKMSASSLYDNVTARQGGTSGAGSWQSTGTTNTSLSQTSVMVQVGAQLSNATSGADVTVTFPNAYTQVPLVFLTVQTANGSNQYVTANSTTTTGFKFRQLTGTTAETVAWIAIGQ